MHRGRLTIPILLTLFLVFTFVAAYFIRKRLLENAMAVALEMKDDRTVRSLFGSWPCPAGAVADDGTTPLHWAAAVGDAGAVERLLDRDVKVDSLGSWPLRPSIEYDTAGATALELAVIGRHKDVVRLFIARDTPVGVLVDKDRRSAHRLLEWTARIGDMEMFRLLVEAGGKDVGGRGLRTAAGLEHREMVQLLLDHGGDIETRNDRGETLLCSAARWASSGFVAFLLERGADPDATDNAGNTPLHLAARDDRVEVVRLLLSHRADVRARNQAGRTALMLAEEDHHTDVAELLRRQGARE